MSISTDNQKKLLKVELEPDMWFEIADHLRDRLTDMQSLMNTVMIDDPDFNRKYLYLKTILECLDNQLTD